MAGNRATTAVLQRDPNASGDEPSSGHSATQVSSAPVRATMALAGGRPGEPGLLRLRIDGDQLRLLFPSVSFGDRAMPGTPIRRRGEPENRERFRLVRPEVRLGLSDGRLSGSAVLEIPSGHPWVDPTPVTIDVKTLESLPSTLKPRRNKAGIGPGAIRASASALAGVIQADADAAVGVRVARVVAVIDKHLGDHVGAALRTTSPVVVAIRDALAKVATGNASVQHAVEAVWATVRSQASSVDAAVLRRQLLATFDELREEVTYPGFHVSGTAKLFGYVPVAKGDAGAATTRRIERPLDGGPPVPMWYFLRGLTVVPAGGRYSTPRPAIGAAAASYGERYGASGSLAAVPGLDPDAISSGKPAKQWFPIDLQLQARAVRRVANGLDLGLQIEAVIPLLGKGGSTATTFDDIRKAVTSPVAISKPRGAYVIGSLTGRFDLP